MDKVIIVAEEDVHAYFQAVYPNWNAQTPVTTVQGLWDGLNAEEPSPGALSPESKIIIFSDHYYDKTHQSEDLEFAIATMAPEALVMVIEYDPDSRNLLRERVTQIATRENMEQGTYYILTPENVEDDVETALAAYSATSDGDTDVNTGNITTDYNAIEADIEPEDTHQGMIITSTSSKGGTGKSTTSLCFANALVRASRKAVEEGKAERPLDVVIVDMDVRDGQLGFFINQTTPTALNIRTQPEWSKEVIREFLVLDERIGAHFLLAPTRARLSEDVPAGFYKDIVGKLRTMFDIVILDTSVNYLDPRLSEVSYPMADAILFVTDLGVSSVFGMNRWLTEVTSPVPEGMGIDQSRIGIVVNKSMTGVSMDRNRVMAASNNVPLLVAIPSKPELYVAMANLNSMDKLLDDPDIGNAYFRLAHKVVGQHYPLSNFAQPQTPQQPGGSAQVAPQPGQPTPVAQGGIRGTPVGGPPQQNYPGYTANAPKKKKGLFGRG